MNMKIDNLNIYYNVFGNGKNVLILHGWGVNHNLYQKIYKNLSNNHKVYVLDLPGFGQSDEPKNPWNTDDYADFIIKFINDLNIKELSIIGHSFGGRIIIKMFNKKMKFKIKKVVLMDSAGVAPKRSILSKIKVKIYKLLKIFVFNKFVMKIFPTSLNNIKNKMGSYDYKNASPMMRQILVKTVNEDLTLLLKNINVPTLLIWGTADTETPFSDALVMEKEIPDAGIAKIEGASHMPFLDNPILVNTILDAFFKEE